MYSLLIQVLNCKLNGVHLLNIMEAYKSCLKVVKLCKPFLANVSPIVKSVNYIDNVITNINSEVLTSINKVLKNPSNVPKVFHNFQDMT